MPEPPDLVLSGVNAGANIADDVTYSGTVAGRHGGNAAGHSLDRAFPGLQLGGGARIVPWEVVETYAPELFAKLVNTPVPEGVFLNVNFPNCSPTRSLAPR